MTMPALEIPRFTLHYRKSKKVFVGKYRESSGTWRPKLVPRTVSSEDAAREWMANWLRQLQANAGVRPLNEEISKPINTMNSLGPRWIELKKQEKGDAYRGDHERCLRLYVYDQPLGVVDVENALGLSDATSWIEWLKKECKHHVTGRPLAPYTVRNVIQAVRELLTDARGRGWIQLRENPFNDPYVKKMASGAQRRCGKNTFICLTAKQAKQLIDCKSEEILPIHRCLNTVALATGARAGELCAFTWADVDWKEKKIQVFHELRSPCRLKKPPVLKPPKKDSHRWIPLHPKAIKALKTWKAGPYQEWCGKTPSGDAPVFPHSSGRFYFTADPDILRANLLAAGLPTKYEEKWPFDVQALRRTTLTMLTDIGAPDAVRSAIAGHGAATVGEKHYVAKNLARFAPWIEKLPL